MKQKFSLIELIVVIAIIGILVSIIVPNIQTLKSDANIVSIKANTRVFQTAVDMYSLKNNGLYPAKEQPTIFVPQPIDVEILYPKYLKTLPKDQGGKYWVDYMGKVWGSTVDAPIGINYEPTQVSWEAVEGSNEYGVYKYEGTAPTGFLGNKSEFAKFKGNITVSNKIATYTREANTIYLVSSVDMYGLETAPVGNGYEGYNTQFPITGTGDFYFTTNAGGIAVWDGIQKTEITPAGTNITYSYATSDDGKTYTSYITDFKSLPNSRYMKVKATSTSSNGTKPTIKRLKVLFYLVGSQGTDENSNEIDIIGSMNGPQSSNVVTDTTDNNIKITDNKTEGTVTHIIPIPSGNTVTDVITSVTNPNGGSGIGGSSGTSGQVQTGVGNGSSGSSGYTQYYQISTDGGSTWQPATPTPYISGLSSGGTHIKIITVITRPSVSSPSPTVEAITVVSAKPQSGSQTGGEGAGGGSTGETQPPTENWQFIEEQEFIVDATEQGDWISIEKTDTQPTGTRIVYTFTYSNDDTTWSSTYTDITQVPNSRLLKVIARLEKTPNATQNPSITEILVNYNIVRTGAPVVYNSRNPQTGGSLTGVSKVAMTGSTSAFLMNNGDVKIVGGSGSGELGLAGIDYTNLATINTLTAIPELTGNVADIKASRYYFVALMKDGTLKGWGSNQYGQFKGIAASRVDIPTTLPGFTDIKEIALGETNIYALRNDGKVISSGLNNYGQMGIGNNTPQSTPVELNLSNIVSIASGSGTAYAVTSTGEAYSWGGTNFGQMGTGYKDTAHNPSVVWVPTPTKITTLSNVKRVYADGNSVLALMDDGSVKGWGENRNSNLGTIKEGTTGNYIYYIGTPQTITTLTNIKDIYMGSYRTVAIANDGTVYTSGDYRVESTWWSSYGFNSNLTPTLHGNLKEMCLSNGGYSGIAIMNDGSIKGIGDNSYNRLNLPPPNMYYSLTDITIQ